MVPYFQHFGLQRDPFSDTADPFFYFETPELRRDAGRLLASVEASRGLAIVLGAAGTGKTSIGNHVEQALLRDERVQIGKILDPAFAGEMEFLLAIGRVFGLALPPRSDAALRNALKNYLFDTAVLEGRTPVLIVDEAQHLTADGLETLRLLLNFDVPDKKLLNVLLFGQNELERTITARTNLRDRVDLWVRLEPLDRPTSEALLDHRLERAGGAPAARIFSDDALGRALDAAAGLPRRLCNLARTSMIEATDRGSERVFEQHVEAALRSTGLTAQTPAAASDEPAAPDRRGGSFFSRLFFGRSSA